MCGTTVKWSMAFPPGLPKDRLGQRVFFAVSWLDVSSLDFMPRLLTPEPGLFHFKFGTAIPLQTPATGA
jgi:hypothetical protein